MKSHWQRFSSIWEKLPPSGSLRDDIISERVMPLAFLLSSSTVLRYMAESLNKERNRKEYSSLSMAFSEKNSRSVFCVGLRPFSSICK